ncbi:MAG: SPOR domain-containing protein [Steroidobacteraceae bacterium]|jgi:cell division septation protein DedD
MRNFRFYSVAIAASALLALGGCSRVGGDWKSAQAADTPEAYQDFLHQHPDSEYSVQAQARIKQLSEDKDWQAASAADTPDAYEQFVAQHADSKWAQEARVRIENFQQSKSPPPVAGNTPGTGAPPPPAALEPSTAAPKTAKAAAKPKPAPKSAASTHTHTPLAQLGAYTSRTRAETAWKHLQEKYPSDLKALKVRYVEAKTSTKTLWRLQVELPTRKAVKSLCASLSHHGQKCIAAN